MFLFIIRVARCIPKHGNLAAYIQNSTENEKQNIMLSGDAFVTVCDISAGTMLLL
jgi:hypothetical protein